MEKMEGVMRRTQGRFGGDLRLMVVVVDAALDTRKSFYGV